jgi:uncharacterized membrane protein
MKKLKITHPILQVLGLGALAGMRSTSAPAITSHILSHHHSKKLENSPLNFMQSEKVATVLKIMALGELIGDKLPTAPNRIIPFACAGRCLSGALAGASIFKATGGNALIGGILGGAAAVASTFGSFYLRKGVVEKTKVLDPVIGAIEDALVISSGIGLARFS